MLDLFVVANAVIVCAYVTVGFYLAPRFTMIGVGVTIAKYAMLAFFFFCAMTHAEMIVHVLTEPRQNVEWMLSAHMQIIHICQAVAAPVFIVFAAKYLQIHLLPLPKSVYYLGRHPDEDDDDASHREHDDDV